MTLNYFFGFKYFSCDLRLSQNIDVQRKFWLLIRVWKVKLNFHIFYLFWGIFKAFSICFFFMTCLRHPYFWTLFNIFVKNLDEEVVKRYFLVFYTLWPSVQDGKLTRCVPKKNRTLYLNHTIYSAIYWKFATLKRYIHPLSNAPNFL